MWSLGVAARSAPVSWMRDAASEAFLDLGKFESHHLRPNAYAALGAVEMLKTDAHSAVASDLLERTSTVIAEATRDRISWPEPRLTYDNARLPEALIAAGVARGDRHLISVGIRLLEWLVRDETEDNHFSFTPAGGRSPGGPHPGFDQQPIEAAAMADACYRAWTASGDPVWKTRALDAARWLVGRNDTGMAVYDQQTGGTSDGLMQHSVNQNRGAESTLAGLAALQIAARCSIADPGTGAY